MNDVHSNPSSPDPHAGAAVTGAVQANGAVKSQTPEEMAGLAEKLGQLERLVRASCRDSLTLVRAQQETQAALQTALTKIQNLELDVKGVSQTVWRATQENQETIRGVEEHYAGALRDLEKRIRDEILAQTQRGVMRSLLPALDDLDLILSHRTREASVQDDPFLKGVLLVRNKLIQGLREQGFEEIPVEPGKTTYDPQQHEAMEPDIPESFYDRAGAGDQEILYVRRAGFTYKGQVFRAPQVFINRS